MIQEEGLITPTYSKVLNLKNPPHRFWLMGVVLRRFISILVVFTLLFLSFSSSAAASAQDFRGGLVDSRKETGGSGLPGRIVVQKRLGGPGSAPPSCRSKCGKCEPCKAVRVPIQPGLIAPLEYYPEAWRCKCGKKIFMP